MQKITKNDCQNLITLCPNHHQEYDNRVFALVPSQHNIKLMIDVEATDFRRREILLQQLPPEEEWTEEDRIKVERKVPSPEEFEPIVEVIRMDGTQDDPAQIQLNPKSHSNDYQINLYALLANAKPTLNRVVPEISKRCQEAAGLVDQLYRLYSRVPACEPPEEALNSSLEGLSIEDTGRLEDTGLPRCRPDATPSLSTGPEALDDIGVHVKPKGRKLWSPSMMTSPPRRSPRRSTSGTGS
ncbi:hypothetical protein DL93DRAFT_2087852 [Clavulina sp. PMI_390]|nr:hypothetical protein DL93DRAFT_2087852 [Clavulina sp. PMI_390]